MQDTRCRVDRTGLRREVARWKMNEEGKMQDEGHREVTGSPACP